MAKSTPEEYFIAGKKRLLRACQITFFAMAVGIPLLLCTRFWNANFANETVTDIEAVDLLADALGGKHLMPKDVRVEVVEAERERGSATRWLLYRANSIDVVRLRDVIKNEAIVRGEPRDVKWIPNSPTPPSWFRNLKRDGVEVYYVDYRGGFNYFIFDQARGLVYLFIWGD